ncbi:MAG: ribosome silencing factor [Alphaproteobacteria bacterium]|nr:ribosome silencing factor [Alphaproteobacteria bacterium]MDE2337041.1 ribosome silencing factor [Alphaproteobacteria bacterium]
MGTTKTTTAKKTKKATAKKAAAAAKAVKTSVKKQAKKSAKKPVAPVKSASLQDFISAALDADKAQDIVCIPLKGKTSIADYMIIATGTSSRHVASMARNLRDKLSQERQIKARIEGVESGDWAILDTGDVMVHIFRAEVRAFYDLEKLWGADFSTVNYTLYQSV